MCTQNRVNENDKNEKWNEERCNKPNFQFPFIGCVFAIIFDIVFIYMDEWSERFLSLLDLQLELFQPRILYNVCVATSRLVGIGRLKG